tara:strand:- start:1734 stop:2648 length:915 start_codon:yes stop_codon:yes gene_type:complete
MSEERVDLLALIDAAKPDLRDATRKSYYYGIKRAAPENVQKRLGVGLSTNPVSVKWITKPAAVLKRISELTIAVQKTTITPLLVLTRYLFGEDSEPYKAYLSKADEYNAVVQATLSEHIKSKNQEDNWIEMDVLRDHVLRMPVDTEKQRTQKLIGALYTFQPPARNDYGQMQIVTDLVGISSDVNYLVCTSPGDWFFYFQNFKTFKSKGPIIVTVSSQMKEQLLSYLDNRELTGFLFEPPMTKGQMGYALAQAFRKTGKHVTVNLIRHMVASDNVDIDQVHEAVKLASDMMHSGEMQLLYAKKV